VEIRPAAPEDYADIAGLIIHELGYENLKPEIIFKRLEAISKDAGHMTLVADMDGRVVGFLGLCRVSSYEIEELILILAFAVSEKLQHQGVGGALLAGAEAYAHAHNIKIIKLTSNTRRTDAHRFYEARGFERKSFGFFKYL
jgi:GNAT superfamily N-acetyltransferase